jgi:CspA family cold shock protein
VAFSVLSDSEVGFIASQMRPYFTLSILFLWGAVMAQGKIKKLIADRGFGFVESDSGNDLFFHHSELQEVSIEELNEGQTLEYELGEGQKGPCAKNVRVI